MELEAEQLPEPPEQAPRPELPVPLPEETVSHWRGSVGGGTREQSRGLPGGGGCHGVLSPLGACLTGDRKE